VVSLEHTAASYNSRGDSHPSLMRPNAAAAIVKYALILSFVVVDCLSRSES
jgi:hypothetical protein